MTRDLPDIYCVLCPSFHGATLLSLLLNNHDKILGMGDTLPPRLLGCYCGCGAPLDQCAFWQSVEDRLAFIGRLTLVPAVPTQLLAKGSDGPVWRDALPEPSRATSAVELVLAPLLMAAINLKLRVPLKRFAASYAEFLAACRSQTDFALFLDGYKSSKHYLALKACGMPVRGAVHLLRDPRAYVASAKRVGYSLQQAVTDWSRSHRAIETILGGVGENVLRLRYEDFCARPEDTLARIQSWMGLEPYPAIHKPSADLHWIGNASMADFTGDIKPSERWRKELSKQELEFLKRKLGKRAKRYNYDLDRTEVSHQEPCGGRQRHASPER